MGKPGLGLSGAPFHAGWQACPAAVTPLPLGGSANYSMEAADGGESLGELPGAIVCAAGVSNTLKKPISWLRSGSDTPLGMASWGCVGVCVVVHFA